MTCFEAQSLITPFIEEELDYVKLEQFLQHVKYCESCKDDLDVYFTLLNGMKQLDENKNTVNTFHIDLNSFLHKQEDKLIQYRRLRIQKRIVLCIFMLILGLWFR